MELMWPFKQIKDEWYYISEDPENFFAKTLVHHCNNDWHMTRFAIHSQEYLDGDGQRYCAKCDEKAPQRVMDVWDLIG